MPFIHIASSGFRGRAVYIHDASTSPSLTAMNVGVMLAGNLVMLTADAANSTATLGRGLVRGAIAALAATVAIPTVAVPPATAELCWTAFAAAYCVVLAALNALA